VSISVLLNGISYDVPQTGEESWGTELTDYLVAIPQAVFQKTGGTFTLTADANFGANFGLLSKYFSTRTASPSTAGLLRLALADTIGWRNNANSANLLLAINGSDQLTFNGTAVYPAGITALTGDITATGPGSVAATLATVNANVGAFALATITVNGKGLITAASAASTTGSGSVVLATSPTLVTPLLGVPTSGTLTNCTGLPISSGVSGLGSGIATFLGTPSSANLATAITDETGSGALVFATSPTLVTPLLGVPTSGTLTNCTGLPISSGVSGLGSGIATFLATPTSANLASAITNETGSGALVFATSPALVTPDIGAATGTSLNLSGLTISQAVVTDGSKNLASLSYVSAPTASTLMSRDASANSRINNLVENYATNATAASNTTLVVGSAKSQYFTGVTTQNIILPDATTLPQTGFQFYIVNLSSGIVTIKDNGSNTIQTLAASSFAFVTAKSIGSANGSWDVQYSTNNAGGGTVTSVAASGPSGIATWSAAVTTSGTLTQTLSNQNANIVLAGPSSGSATTPAFRALVPLDTKYAINAQVTSYTLLTTDSVVTFDASGAGRTATLPTAVGFSGLIFTIKKIDNSTNLVTLATTSAQTIDGAASSALTLATQYESVTVCSDGANWVILDHKCNTSMTAYTPTWSAGLGTVSNSSGYWRRVGDCMEVYASCTIGTTAASIASISIPTIGTISSAKLSLNNTTGNPGNSVGRYGVSEATANVGGAIVTAPSTSTTVVYCATSDVNAASHLTPANGTAVTASSVTMAISFTVPIANWFA
jgi:hypothetical protein